MLFSTLGPSSLPVVVAQPDERHENKAASGMTASGMTDTEHSTISSSIEEKEQINITSILFTTLF